MTPHQSNSRAAIQLEHHALHNLTQPITYSNARIQQHFATDERVDPQIHDLALNDSLTRLNIING